MPVVWLITQRRLTISQSARTRAQPLVGKPASGALREACSRAAHALAALIAPVIVLMTPAALGLSRDSVHAPVHALKTQTLAFQTLVVS
jgi:hypothetical protein